VFGGEGFEACDCFFAEVGQDVDVGFDHGDVRAQTCWGDAVLVRNWGCRG
jgi:hypothetical protein